MKNKALLFGLLIIAALLVAACQPQTVVGVVMHNRDIGESKCVDDIIGINITLQLITQGNAVADIAIGAGNCWVGRAGGDEGQPQESGRHPRDLAAHAQAQAEAIQRRRCAGAGGGRMSDLLKGSDPSGRRQDLAAPLRRGAVIASPLGAHILRLPCCNSRGRGLR